MNRKQKIFECVSKLLETDNLAGYRTPQKADRLKSGIVDPRNTIKNITSYDGDVRASSSRQNMIREVPGMKERLDRLRQQDDANRLVDRQKAQEIDRTRALSGLPPVIHRE